MVAVVAAVMVWTMGGGAGVGCAAGSALTWHTVAVFQGTRRMGTVTVSGSAASAQIAGDHRQVARPPTASLRHLGAWVTDPNPPVN